MSQRKYIIYAFLILTTGIIIYFGYKKVSSSDKSVITKNAVSDRNYEIADSLSLSQANGKRLFQSQCASCHLIFKNATGNALAGVENRWPDKKELFAFIRNPEMIISKNSYVRKLKDEYGSVMTAFPDLTDDEIQAILDYIKVSERAKPIAIPEKPVS